MGGGLDQRRRFDVVSEPLYARIRHRGTQPCVPVDSGQREKVWATLLALLGPGLRGPRAATDLARKDRAVTETALGFLSLSLL